MNVHCKQQNPDTKGIERCLQSASPDTTRGTAPARKETHQGDTPKSGRRQASVFGAMTMNGDNFNFYTGKGNPFFLNPPIFSLFPTR